MCFNTDYQVIRRLDDDGRPEYWDGSRWTRNTADAALYPSIMAALAIDVGPSITEVVSLASAQADALRPWTQIES